jgi:outer membrane immunogenic protein
VSSRIGVFAAAFLAAVTAASHAADLPPRIPIRATPVAPAAPSWTGVYIGLFAGYGWGRAGATEATDPALQFPFYNALPTPYRFDVDGAFAGATVGYNWQTGAMVFGVEGEVGYLGLRGSLIDPNGTVFFGTPDTKTSFKSDLYGAVYGRLGIAAGNALIYAKGGVAFLDAEASTIDPCANAPGCGTTTLTMTGDKVMVGWSAAGGIEWMFGPQWSGKLEYAYFDFGRIGTAGPSSVAGEFYRQTIDVTVHTAKAGINYRFGGRY